MPHMIPGSHCHLPKTPKLPLSHQAHIVQTPPPCTRSSHLYILIWAIQTIERRLRKSHPLMSDCNLTPPCHRSNHLQQLICVLCLCSICVRVHHRLKQQSSCLPGQHIQSMCTGLRCRPPVGVERQMVVVRRSSRASALGVPEFRGTKKRSKSGRTVERLEIKVSRKSLKMAASGLASRNIIRTLSLARSHANKRFASSSAESSAVGLWSDARKKARECKFLQQKFVCKICTGEIFNASVMSPPTHK